MPGSEIASSSSRHEFTVSIGMSVVVPADATRHTGPMRRAAPLPPSIRRRMAHEIFALVSVPFLTGAIGYLTNWTGVWMLFEPLEFKGIHIPGLSKLIRVMPRKIQQIPGIMSGGLGWQGIIPSRAAKMGSIAVHKAIAKAGRQHDFYEQPQPERRA